MTESILLNWKEISRNIKDRGYFHNLIDKTASDDIIKLFPVLSSYDTKYNTDIVRKSIGALIKKCRAKDIPELTRLLIRYKKKREIKLFEESLPKLVDLCDSKELMKLVEVIYKYSVYNKRPYLKKYYVTILTRCDLFSSRHIKLLFKKESKIGICKTPKYSKKYSKLFDTDYTEGYSYDR
ncbi:MAG: hypothetical protein JJV93_03170 [Alphaproteobacteria bacterium]|nr:hypothetical protein [Alphaproteobacteria bacterium]MBL0718229.1 hypothetical protein [Alphaproteobacteria bacterium]